MKTIVCGPPHSGKTVLIANLLKFMPSDSYLRINANGDGEGTWSNNPDQKEVLSVRVKTGNTPEEFAAWERRIRAATQDIVLVDIGGRLQDDKGPLFDAADSFVVLSSDPSMTEPWKEFGEAHGCRCLATLESVLEGEHAVISTEPYLKARVAGLERGSTHVDSVALKALADVIVRASGYRRTELVDFHDIGSEAGCALDWVTSEGVPVTHVHFRTEAAPLIHEILSRRHNPFTRYRLYNLRTNWVAVLAANSLGAGDVSALSFYDDWTASFIRPAILEKTAGETTGVISTVNETEDAVFVSMKAKGMELDPEHFTEYTIPIIDESKALYLSGRFPTWFTVSVLGSYASREQHVLQPGNHYICVRSEDVNKLGTKTTFDK